MHHPVVAERGDRRLALYGSFLESLARVDGEPPGVAPAAVASRPGATDVADGSIEINAGRKTVSLVVTNRGDRPIQVGSHYHFVEVNRALNFDRGAAYGKRLDIPAGTAVRFEPGEAKTVSLVDIAGARVIRGGIGLANGPVTDEGRRKIAAVSNQ